MASSWFRACIELLALSVTSLTKAEEMTFYNPVLPGWHSDPSCVHVDGTFYCITSTFISFPGMPIYASTDLINWRLISHVWNRESQMSGAAQETKGQQEGFYAATIRHHDGKFWVACEYLGLERGMIGTVFTSTNPFDEESWSDLYIFMTQAGDLDLFWDDDGTIYIPGGGSGAKLQKVDLETGEVLSTVDLWPGTGGVWPEGPHIYRKDGWYYLTLAEGGTETGHYQVMARSKNLTGPYEACPFNPVLTNKGTDEYIQTIGHADLFQDSEGNWWGMALGTRSGPEWYIYPMGRETVLFPVTWEDGEWPIMEPVRGMMSSLRLPSVNKSPPGNGPLNSDPDFYTFPAGTQIPKNFRGNITGDNGDLDGRSGLSFIGRRQTDSLFTFYVDILTDLRGINQEAGVSLFLTQKNHADLGVVLLPHPRCPSQTQRVFRFRATGENAPPESKFSVPSSWGTGPVRFEISTVNSTQYSFVVSAASDPEDRYEMGTVNARLVSGQSGPFTGSLVGAYATCNGEGSGIECPEGGEALVTEWKYTGQGQYYTETDLVPAVRTS